MSSKIISRESLRNSQNIQIPALPVLAIRGYLCFRCFLPSKHLSKCAGCKRAVYCGKDCQNRDWQIQHKKDCKVLKIINTIEAKETAPSRTRGIWTESLLVKVEVIQNQTRDTSPRDIITAQPHCVSCHRSAVHIPSSTMLKACPTCNLVSICETCTLPQSHECELYQHYGSIELFRINQFEECGQYDCRAPTGTPRSTYRALSTVSSWREYFTDISDKKDSVSYFVRPDFSLDNALLRKLQDPELEAAIRRVWLCLLVATDVSTIPLTILAALEDSSHDFATCQTLLIHVIGAASREFHNLSLLEEILHLVPSVQNLKVVHIGPKSPAATEGTGNEINLGCCPACTSRGRKRTVIFSRMLYHDYAKELNYRKPDFAVLFHSGRSQAEEESWRPTTKFLVVSEILTVCTTYTQREAREEVAELDKLGARLIRRPEVSKWRSLVPILDFLEGEEHSVYYLNYYRYIFHGRR